MKGPNVVTRPGTGFLSCDLPWVGFPVPHLGFGPSSPRCCVAASAAPPLVRIVFPHGFRGGHPSHTWPKASAWVRDSPKIRDCGILVPAAPALDLSVLSMGWSPGGSLSPLGLVSWWGLPWCWRSAHPTCPLSTDSYLGVCLPFGQRTFGQVSWAKVPRHLGAV